MRLVRRQGCRCVRRLLYADMRHLPRRRYQRAGCRTVLCRREHDPLGFGRDSGLVMRLHRSLRPMLSERSMLNILRAAARCGPGRVGPADAGLICGSPDPRSVRRPARTPLLFSAPLVRGAGSRTTSVGTHLDGSWSSLAIGFDVSSANYRGGMIASRGRVWGVVKNRPRGGGGGFLASRILRTSSFARLDGLSASRSPVCPLPYRPA